LAKINPQMIRQWSLSISALNSEQQLFDFGEVVGGQTTFNVKLRHSAQDSGEAR
jgi:hypothetical protein